MQIIKADGVAEFALLQRLEERSEQVGQDVMRSVSQIIADVRARGDQAVREMELGLRSFNS